VAGEPQELKASLDKYQQAINWYERRAEVKADPSKKEYKVSAPDLSQKGSTAEETFIDFQKWRALARLSERVGPFPMEDPFTPGAWFDTNHIEQARAVVNTIQNTVSSTAASSNEKGRADNFFKRLDRTLSDLLSKEAAGLSRDDLSSFHRDLVRLYEEVFRALTRFVFVG